MESDLLSSSSSFMFVLVFYLQSFSFSKRRNILLHETYIFLYAFADYKKKIRSYVFAEDCNPTRVIVEYFAKFRISKVILRFVFMRDWSPNCATKFLTKWFMNFNLQRLLVKKNCTEVKVSRWRTDTFLFKFTSWQLTSALLFRTLDDHNTFS